MIGDENMQNPRFKSSQFLSNNIVEVVKSTTKLCKTIFEEENKIDNEPDVQTIEESNIEMMVARVIASLHTSLRQVILTSSAYRTWTKEIKKENPTSTQVEIEHHTLSASRSIINK